MSPTCATCTELVRWTDPVCFRAGIVTKAWACRKALQPMDEVIGSISRVERPGRLHYRGSSRLRLGGSLHQADLSTQEALPPPGARLPPPHGLAGGRQGGAKPPTQGAPAPGPIAGWAGEEAFPAPPAG